MTLVSSQIPTFTGGVSQQPPSQRLSSQLTEQINGYSTVSRGLQKRPPCEHIAKIYDLPVSDAFLHVINRDEDERYLVVLMQGNLKVYDLAGNEMVVNFPNGKAYLETDNPCEDYMALTVADHTFIVNKTRRVEMDSTRSPSRPYEALVYVKLGNYGKTYTITINGTQVASFTTPDGTNAAHSPQISTDHIAIQLFNGINLPGINKSLVGSTIHLWASSDFSLSTTDGYNNTAMIPIKGKVQKVGDLPSRHHARDFKCCIVGEAGSEDDDFWVSYDMSGSTGVWVEDVAPAIPLRPLASSMPHALIREADGTFTFKPLSWDDRCAGDEDSNPEPSFVGQKLHSMFFFRNRLGFLAEDSMILSSAGNYFNFWRTSVKGLLDEDPIDVSASHTKVAFLYHAVPYNQQLFLFSEQSQFVLQESDVLSARTTSIRRTTDYPCSKQAIPVSTGKNVYFVTDRGKASAVRELYTDENTGEDTTDITAHVPSYIPNGCYKIAQSPTEDVLIFLTREKQNVLYVYSYYWNGSQKLQSAWSKWEFPETDHILYGEFINSILYLAVTRADGVYLESIRLSLDGELPEELYSVMLDRKVSIETPVSTDNRITLLPVPYRADGGTYQAVSAETVGQLGGKIWPARWDGENFYIDEILPEGTKLWFGRQYVFSVELSTLYLSQQGQTGSRSYTNGRLTIRNISVNFADTGFFRVKVTPEGRSEQVKTYTGKTLGTSAQIGSHQITTGAFRVPVMTKNLNTKIIIENDSPLPSALISADWEGDYVTRTQRL